MQLTSGTLRVFEHLAGEELGSVSRATCLRASTHRQSLPSAHLQLTRVVGWFACNQCCVLCLDLNDLKDEREILVYDAQHTNSRDMIITLRGELRETNVKDS